jgi:uncharacterized protein (TIGR02453 family)
MERFTGFARNAPRFFHELAVEMNRDWFAEHKAEYEALWVQPMQALLAEVARGLAPTYRRLGLGEPSIFRIHRDVRFAADKAPYKTHIAGVVPLRHENKPTEGAVALYLHLGLDERLGAGHYAFDAAQLARWRRLVAADRTGGAIAKLCDAAVAAGMPLQAREVLARAPRGVDPAHPRVALLRHKGLIVGFPPIPRGLIHEPGLVDWLVAQAREAAPIVTWLRKYIG